MKKIFTLISTALILILSSVAVKGEESKIYLAGPFNFYGFMGSFSEKWEMTSDDNIVYRGTFLIPRDKMIFCVYDYLDEDHYTIYGSKAREGNRVAISFTETDGLYSAEMEYAGQGDWASEDWPGGEASFEIDFGQAPPKIKVTTEVNPRPEEENGVARIDDLPADTPVYNLQGVKMDKSHLAPGLYIAGGKLIRIGK